jgi:hypothetical protein
MLPDTGIDDVKKQRNVEYAKHINDPVLSSLTMEGIRLLFFNIYVLNFMNIRSVGAELFHVDGRTDGRTDRPNGANSRFSHFCERAYKWHHL